MRIGTLGESVKRAAIGSIAVVLLTAVCFRGHIELTVAIPLYMLLVVLQSLTGDFLSSALIAALSAAMLGLFLYRASIFSIHKKSAQRRCVGCLHDYGVGHNQISVVGTEGSQIFLAAEGSARSPLPSFSTTPCFGAGCGDERAIPGAVPRASSE